MCKVFTNRWTFIPKEILIFQTFKQWMKILWFLKRNYNRGGRLLRILLIFSISDSSSYWNLQINFDIQEFSHLYHFLNKNMCTAFFRVFVRIFSAINKKVLFDLSKIIKGVWLLISIILVFSLYWNL